LSSSYDGSVRILTELNTGDYERGLRQLNRSTTDFCNGVMRKVAAVAAGFIAFDKIGDFTKSGIEYNRQLENARVGIATIISLNQKVFDSQGRMLEGQQKYNKALEMSTEMVKALDVASVKSPAEFSDLMVGFQTNLGSARRLGLEWQNVMDITVDMSNVLMAMNIPMENLARETTAVLTGERLYYSQVARRLQLTREEIKSWGTGAELMANFARRFKEMESAGEAVAGTFEASRAYFKDVVQSLAGNVTTGLFESLKVAMMEVSDAFYEIDEQTGKFKVTPEMQGLVDFGKNMATAFGKGTVSATQSLMEAMRGVSGFLKENEGDLRTMASAGDDAAVALLALALAHTRVFKAMATPITSVARITRALSGEVGAWNALKVAVTGDTTALYTNAVAKKKAATDAVAVARANVALAETDVVTARNNVRAATTTAQRTRAITALLAAEGALLRSKGVLATAEAVEIEAQGILTTVTNSSTVAKARAAEAEAAEALAIAQTNLQRARAQTFIARQIGAEEMLILALREEAIAQQMVNAATIKAGVTKAATAEATAALTLWSRALTAAKTGLSSLLAMAGGVSGIVFMGLAYGIYTLATRETEADRVTKRDAETLDEVRKKMTGYKDAIDGTSKSLEDMTILESQQIFAQNQKYLAELRKDVEAIFRGPVQAGIRPGQKMVNVDIQKHLDVMGEDFKAAFLKLKDTLLTGKGDITAELAKFDKDWSIKLEELINTGTEGQARAAKVIRGILRVLFVNDWDGQEGTSIAELIAALLKELEVTETKTAEVAASVGMNVRGIIYAAENELTATERVAARLKELGLELNGVDFVEASDGFQKLWKDLREFDENMGKTIDSMRTRWQQLGDVLSAGVGTPEELEKVRRLYERLGVQIVDMERRRITVMAAMRAEEEAKQVIAREESLKGEELTADRKVEIYEGLIRAAMAANQEIAKAEFAKNEKILADQAKTIDAMMANYLLLAQAGSVAAFNVYGGLQVAQQKNQEQLAALRAEQDKYNADSEKATQEAISGFRARLTKGGGNGTGPGGDLKTTADEARKSLQEVELTLARMRGDTVKVVEIEQLQALESFKELVAKTGVDAAKAAEYMEKFKEAQAIEVRTENLQLQMDFYDKLRSVLPAAGVEYAKLREEMLQLEAAQYRAIGMNPEWVKIWEVKTRIQEATDAFSGLQRAFDDYIGGLTPAKAAMDLFQESQGALTDALVEGLWNVDSFGEAMSNLADTVIKALQRMAVEMLVVRPIMQGLQSLLGGLGGGGGFFSFLSGIFGSAHRGGIVGAGDTGPDRRVSPLAFAGAERYHSGGILGLRANEIPIIAKKGEMILTSADQRNLLSLLRSGSAGGGGQGNINIQVVNQTSAKMDASSEARRNPNGDLDVQVFLTEIDKGMANKQSKGESAFDRSMRDSYSLNPNTKLYRGG
jgi:hypothetical protein